jgi:hypothetical protein
MGFEFRRVFEEQNSGLPLREALLNHHAKRIPVAERVLPFADRIISPLCYVLPESTGTCAGPWPIFRYLLLKIFQYSVDKDEISSYKGVLWFGRGQAVIIIDSNFGPRRETSIAFCLSLLSTQALYLCGAKQATKQMLPRRTQQATSATPACSSIRR